MQKRYPRIPRCSRRQRAPRHDKAPARRLRQVLQSQGVEPDQALRFLSDGADSLHLLLARIAPDAEHVLDWFHITKRFTVLGNYLAGLIASAPDEQAEDGQDTGEKLKKKAESAKWKLWHGKVEDAVERLQQLRAMVDAFEGDYARRGALVAALEEFEGYVARNAYVIPCYAENFRSGRTISTAFVESLINSILNKRFCKSQQMQWTTMGAHLLLQLRTKLANGELSGIVGRWDPGMFQIRFIPADAAQNVDEERSAEMEHATG